MSGRGKKGGQTYHGDLFMLGPKSGSSKVSAPAQSVGHGQPPSKKSKTIKSSSGGAGGWTAPTAPASSLTPAQRKEAEAAASAASVQNGYYDPGNPNVAYVPPPAYNDLPPAYEDHNKKDK